jgi:glycosyltransferase involved in cell wall biosynthesis
MKRRRPAVTYVSYDGMGEPLGRSQVLAYLERLTFAANVTLISFEKPGADEAALRQELEAKQIRWVPLLYHKRPPVLSTAWDVWAGARALRREARRREPDIVHVRSYVPALIALRSGVTHRARLLFDIRGFWADERVEGGIWPAGGRLYRVAKRYERRFFAAADAVVTLTHASVPQVREWLGDRQVPVEVIPTCVDPQPYAHGTERSGGAHAVWSGSLTTWYRFDLAVRFARELGLPFTVLTREVESARAALDGVPADVRTVPQAAMRDELREGDVGLCLIRRSFSKTASAPTRLAEYLAAGMPVAVTPVGDLERIVEEGGVGVVLREEDDASLADAAERVKRLAVDPAVRARCRAVAREVFDVEAGARAYATLYESLTAPA